MAQVETWHESAAELMAQVETSRVRLKYLGRGFLALVFMIGTLAGLAGGFLALLAVRLAGGVGVSQLKRLKEVEADLAQYKKMYAELAHENYALKELIEKKL